MKTLLKNGVLVDKTSTLNHKTVSVLIEDGRISEVSEDISEAGYSVIDLNGAFVSAGWIDMHVHCFNEAWDEGISPDRVGVESGVTMLVDAGSSGADNVEEFFEKSATHKTKIRAMLNISRLGLTTLHELRKIEDIDVERAIGMAEAYPDFIVGFKLRASASVMGDDFDNPFLLARKIQTKVKKPLMVHVGNFPPSLDDVLGYLEKGDIVTHCYNGKPNGIISDGLIRESVLKARERGVLFDVGHGTSSYSHSVARNSKALGFYPDTAGTDIYRKNVGGPVYSLAHTMSKLMSLGYTMDECIAMNTVNAASALRLDSYGSVKPGKVADLSVFRKIVRESIILDSEGEEINLNEQIVPVAVVIDGEWKETIYGNEEHIH
ncbi:amidohydrolase/deacetylase family metallohydrolase [Youngiibacter multivorans]|uniref:Dihydroorotase n=1 Tax=Youngiibacter multivorans TaxID=937251 RepID=A0ABS4G822_9CLOT|nr:amidohydrolase/deacetylase family metallohydrolase [Youngiibacter multivorans]MBP1920713.1 dihydroorotase [Youngiibacter multivorans]